MRPVDVHQHLWPDGVLRVLERRGAPPRARWQDDRWLIAPANAPAFKVDPKDHDPDERGHRLTVDKALVALSSPVGLEALPARDALAAVAAWQEAAKELPPELGWWAATPKVLEGDGEAELAKEAIADGAAGVCLPADRLATPEEAQQALPLLQAVADAGAPVFIHPGPANGSQAEPAWWSPATRYVAQQHAAWHSFHDAIRPQLPTVRAIFALLAGLAPLQAERTDNKGGPDADMAVADSLTFYDTSSYGPKAVRAMGAAVGIGQLVHGTDHPVAQKTDDPVEEAFGEGFAQLVRTAAPNRHVEIYLVCWMPAHDTGFHDHDDSAAAITVLDRTIAEERLALSGTVHKTLTTGDTVTIAREAIHSVSHAGTRPATTLHAYSPPLRRVGTYEVADDGALLRHPRPAQTPLEAAA